MKTRIFTAIAATALLLVAQASLPVSSLAQVPGIMNYQGRVVDAGTNFDGTGQFEFALVNTSGTTNYWSNDGTVVGQPSAAVSLTVTKGLYSVLLGDTTIANMSVAITPAVFANSDVRLRVFFNDGVNGFQQLSPDQRIAAVGYALNAGGSGWSLAGNAGTSPTNGNFLGTTDNQPLELRVNNSRVLRLESSTVPGFSPNIIGGLSNNLVPAGVYGSVIAGGGATGGNNNEVSSDYGVVGGGQNNLAGDGVAGHFNGPTIAGGIANRAENDDATVGGGGNNAANGQYATVPGGSQNAANGTFSFAAGQQALASHQGAFVWADSQNTTFASTAQNQFLIRAGGGVGIGKNNPATALDVNGTVTATAFSGDGTGLTGVSAAGFSGSLAGDVTGTQGATIVGTVDGVSAANVASGANAANAATSANTASTIVKRDGSGNITIGTVTGNLNGNATTATSASSATTATTANNFSGSLAGDVTGTQGATTVAKINNSPLGAISSPASGQVLRYNGSQWVNSAIQSGDLPTGGSSDVLGKRLNIGTNNTLNGAYATIAGGSNNTAGGTATFVGGGQNNIASALDATVAGGFSNIASGAGAFIGGGGWDGSVLGSNVARGAASVVVGGNFNIARNVYDTVGGGGQNTARGGASVVAGGVFNSASGADAVVGGGLNNIASGPGAFVGGGGWDGTTAGSNVASGAGSVIGGGNFNFATNRYSTVGGGDNNVAYGRSSTVGGGELNIASADFATVGSGSGNLANAPSAMVGGGTGNIATGPDSTVSGGSGNVASGIGAFVGGGGYDGRFPNGNVASGVASVVGGGVGNIASNLYAMVPGGDDNVAGGTFSFAAGQQAQALHQGAFVWADSQNAVFASTANDQFLIRAHGGVGIGTASPDAMLSVNGTADKPGGGSWGTFSDVRLKKNVEPLRGALDRLLELRAVTFEYKDPQSIHELPGIQIGMVAQEVEKVFPDWVDTAPNGMKRLSIHGFEALTVEALRELREEKDAKIAALRQQNTALEKRLEQMEKRLDQVSEQVEHSNATVQPAANVRGPGGM